MPRSRNSANRFGVMSFISRTEQGKGSELYESHGHHTLNLSRRKSKKRIDNGSFNHRNWLMTERSMQSTSGGPFVSYFKKVVCISSKRVLPLPGVWDRISPGRRFFAMTLILWEIKSHARHPHSNTACFYSELLRIIVGEGAIEAFQPSRDIKTNDRRVNIVEWPGINMLSGVQCLLDSHEQLRSRRNPKGLMAVLHHM